jgi:hypothetical protein
MAHLLDRLLSNIEMLSSTPRPGEQLLPNIAQSIPPPLQIPLLAHDLTSSHVAAIDRTAAVTATGYRFEDMPAQVGDLVAQAWEYILEPVQDQRVPTCDEPTTRVTRFYDAWDNLIATAQFADFYARRGVQVLVEEMVECPSMLAQSLLLAERIHVSLPPSPPSPPHPPDINPVVDTSTMTKKLFHLGQAAKANGVVNGAPVVSLLSKMLTLLPQSSLSL